MNEWSNLREQLHQLGVKLGMQDVAQKQGSKRHPIESVLDCHETHTPNGTILSVRQCFNYDYAQGNTYLKPYTPFSWLLRWAKIPETEHVTIKNLVFLDAETTGLSGGTGTMAFMVGVGKFIDNTFLLEQYFLRNPAEEEAFLYALSLFCSDMKAVVSYNGKSFDIPILNTRHFLQRVPSPFQDVYHIDLLTISRQIWRLRLNQCRLANIEQNILDFQREGGEVPGYLAPEFYKDYLRTGDARPLKGVFYHNQEDVVSLAALFNHIARILDNPNPDEIGHTNDIYSVGKVFENLRDLETAQKLYEHSLDHETDENLRLKYLLKQAHLLKRNGQTEKSIELYILAAEQNSIEALIAIAKHHEHKSKDLKLALSYTTKAIQIAESELNQDTKLILALQHRKNRLEEKINKLIDVNDGH